MVRSAAKIFGYVFVAIGLLGFVPGLAPDNHLLGIFHINTLHNLIHLASGAVALWAGYSSFRASRLYFQVFGVVYGLVALLGLMSGDNDILGLVANNMADVVLHIVIAASALYWGFGAARDEAIV
jgi:hypothetical protein